jgi:hypothetical protein
VVFPPQPPLAPALTDKERMPQYPHKEATRPKELLTHIIKLAKRAGFTFKNFLDDYDSFVITSFNYHTGRMAFVLRSNQQLKVVYDSIYTLFFDITFAEALFGENWEQHLIKLAEAPDKLDYIARNLYIPMNYETTDQNPIPKSA